VIDQADKAGIGISVFGHVALLGLLSIAVANVVAPPPPPAMEVSYVDEVGLTSTSLNPAPAAPPSAAEQGPLERAAPAPEPEPVPPSPAPAPAPAAPRPTPRQAEAPPTRPVPAQRPQRRQGNEGARAADRTPGPLNLDPRSFGTDPQARSGGAPAAALGPQARASIAQAIVRALMRCQRQPLPTPEAAAIRVIYQVTLNRDGSLAGARFVRVINPDPGLAMYEQRMRDLALNVINACTPIRGLPAEYYDVPGGWRQFPYQFDPRTVR
jgi:outer membrane biosynthesis protein TonB